MIDDEKTLLPTDDERTLLPPDEEDSEKTLLPENEDEPELGEIVKGDIVDDYVIGELLNEKGGEANIRLCKKDGKTFVIKIFRTYSKEVEKTSDLLQGIDSPYVMKIISHGIFKGHLYQIMPYYKNGTLGDLKKPMSISFLCENVIPQMNEGLYEMHSRGITHNDLKPSNVFISDDRKTVVIGDFGLIAKLEERTSVTNVRGGMTAVYAAPEADSLCSAKTDYYAFGRTIQALALGGNPLKGLSEKDARRAIEKDDVPIQEELPVEIKSLIYILTLHSPKDRGGYDEVNIWIKNHNAFLPLWSGRKSYSDLHFEPFTIRGSDGVRHVFETPETLADFLISDWASGMKYFKSNIFSEHFKNIDHDAHFQLNEYYETNLKDSPDVGLFLTIRFLSPEARFVFKGKEFLTFNEIVEEMVNHISDPAGLSFVNFGFFKTAMKYFKMPDSPFVEKACTKTKDVCIRAEYLVNYFNDKTGFVIVDWAKYASLEECVENALFDHKTGALISHKSEMENPALFYEAITHAFKADGEAIEFTSIAVQHDVSGRYVTFAHNVLGHVLLWFNNERIKNFAELVSVGRKLYEHGEESQYQDYLRLFENKFLIDAILFYEDNNYADLRKAVRFLPTAKEKLAYISYFTGETPPYQGCKTLAEFAKKISAEPNDKLFVKACKAAMADPTFKMWLASQGIEEK